MLAIRGGKVFYRDAFREGLTILVDGGKIRAVEENIAVPVQAEVVELAGQYVLPGLIDAHTHVGICEEGIGFEGEDCNEMTEPVTPHLRAVDAVNPEDLGFHDALEGGVTTVFTGPGSANVIGGMGVVLKTAGRVVDEMVLRQEAGLKIAFGENPKRVYADEKKLPSTRMAMAALLRSTLVEAQNYLRKAAKAAKEADEVFERDLKMEAVGKVLEKKIPLRAHAHRADDIMTALRIAAEFDVQIVLEHCTEGHKIAEIIAAAGVPAVVGPSLSSRSKVELREMSFATAGILARAGVKVALMTDHPVIPIKYLPLCAGLAVKEGMPEVEAVKAITINPAQILGIADRVGSIEVGKDADLAIFSGYPFEVRTKVERVYIEGKKVYGE